MISFTLNGEPRTLDLDPRMPLLWALRDHLGLTGTKYGCGSGQCGACLVHLDGEPANACITPIAQVEGRAVTTIEGLSPDGRHPVQLAWIASEVPQCGYCQPAQIMAAAALLASHPQPSEGEIDAAMSRVLCRCGTYSRIRQAIRRALNPEMQETKVD
jgi:isoquinoline 1-oxidoreductase alpha subunit